jgi:hypothetical protein
MRCKSTGGTFWRLVAAYFPFGTRITVLWMFPIPWWRQAAKGAKRHSESVLHNSQPADGPPMIHIWVAVEEKIRVYSNSPVALPKAI